jgi:NAD(P)-dependent dehydrogenase (short-subunit alcohol dehydrogenase family)
MDGRVAIVTGGASGIGLAISKRLTAEGCKVSISGRNTARVAAAVKEINEGHGTAIGVRCDVRNVDEVNHLVDETVDKLGRVDYLVNNAGLFPTNISTDMTEEMWDTVVDTNLKGAFFCAKAAGKWMIASKVKGRVVNISSTASIFARPGVAHYASTKSGLVQMTKVLAVEWAPYSIRVNVVCPGVIATGTVAEIMSNPDGKEEYEAKARRIPMGRFGQAEEIAEAVLFFLSERSSYCTGSSLVADGGYTLGLSSYKI